MKNTFNIIIKKEIMKEDFNDILKEYLEKYKNITNILDNKIDYINKEKIIKDKELINNPLDNRCLNQLKSVKSNRKLYQKLITQKKKKSLITLEKNSILKNKFSIIKINQKINDLSNDEEKRIRDIKKKLNRLKLKKKETIVSNPNFISKKFINYNNFNKHKKKLKNHMVNVSVSYRNNYKDNTNSNKINLFKNLQNYIEKSKYTYRDRLNNFKLHKYSIEDIKTNENINIKIVNNENEITNFLKKLNTIRSKKIDENNSSLYNFKNESLNKLSYKNNHSFRQLMN